jgi:hypothetical protein
MDKNDSVIKKAELIIYDKLYIPKDIKLPYPIDRSTAGPGAGSLSIALTFANKNVKMTISRDQKERFSLQRENEKFQILKDGENFLDNVKIAPILLHAPGQAFINLDDRCIYGCVFCNLPKRKILQKYDVEKIVKLILKTSNRNDFKAVALTSGIYPDNSEIISKMCYIVKNVKKNLPDIPIGVEPCISSKKEILLLKKAGADEIKVNLQIPDENLFVKICPDFCYKYILDVLEESVRIFGVGRVTSNIIYGLGESDKSVFKAIEKLSKMGVVPNLRKIRINKFSKKKLDDIMSYKSYNISVDRILKIAQYHKEILERYCLTTKTFDTMCFKCGCCDIVPFWDV